MNFAESETLELKKSTSEIKEANVSIVSILNKNQHGELTIETIRTKMVSERRNELIAEMLHRVHFIEK